MAGRNLPRKVTYFEPVPPPLARNTVIRRHSRSVPQICDIRAQMGPKRNYVADAPNAA